MILGVRYSKSQVTCYCGSCGHVIQEGEKYHRSAQLDDGSVWNYKEHIWCKRAIDALLNSEAITHYDESVRPIVTDMDEEEWRVLLEADPEAYQEVADIQTRCTPGCNDYMEAPF